MAGLMQKVGWIPLDPNQFHFCSAPELLNLNQDEEGESSRRNTPVIQSRQFEGVLSGRAQGMY